MTDRIVLDSEDLEIRAKEVLDKGIYDYVAGGAGRERTLRANLEEFGRYSLLTRVLSGISDPDTSIKVLGEQLSAPIIIAPIGGQKMLHPDGELAVARAAASCGVGMMVSAGASVTLEEIAGTNGLRKWFQLYWQSDREQSLDLVDRAADAGYSGLFITVDAQVSPMKLRDLRNEFKRPVDVPFANLEKYGRQDIGQGDQRERGTGRGTNIVDGVDPASLSWRLIEDLRRRTSLPFGIKGILRPEDARRAADLGVDAVVVSNHGGRQLDGVPSPLATIRSIRDEVGNAVTIVFDSGIRNATDIVVALALGADVVTIGRPVLWALASGGQDVVEGFLGGMISELKRTMVRLGTPSLSEIGPGVLYSEP